MSVNGSTEDYLKACLYDVEWQKLRVSLLAENNDYGGFGTINGVNENITKLSRYRLSLIVALGPKEYARRVWRTLNLLNATLLGYGTRMNGTTHELLVTSERDYLSGVWSEVKVVLASATDWDWDKVGRDLEALYKEDRAAYDMIWKNLQKRVKTANRKEKAGIGGMKHRNELRKFLDAMEYAKAIVDAKTGNV